MTSSDPEEEKDIPHTVISIPPESHKMSQPRRELSGTFVTSEEYFLKQQTDRYEEKTNQSKPKHKRSKTVGDDHLEQLFNEDVFFEIQPKPTHTRSKTDGEGSYLLAELNEEDSSHRFDNTFIAVKSTFDVASIGETASEKLDKKRVKFAAINSRHNLPRNSNPREKPWSMLPEIASCKHVITVKNVAKTRAVGFGRYSDLRYVNNLVSAEAYGNILNDPPNTPDYSSDDSLRSDSDLGLHSVELVENANSSFAAKKSTTSAEHEKVDVLRGEVTYTNMKGLNSKFYNLQEDPMGDYFVDEYGDNLDLRSVRTQEKTFDEIMADLGKRQRQKPIRKFKEFLKNSLHIPTDYTMGVLSAMIIWISAFAFMGSFIYTQLRTFDDGLPRSTLEQNLSQWTYVGFTNPQRWGSVEVSFEVCGRGSSQSPINLQLLELDNEEIRFANATLPEFVQYPEQTLFQVLRDSASIPYYFCQSGCGEILWSNKTYVLNYMYIRSPSEHTYHGARFPMEAQLYHLDSENVTRWLALGLWFQALADTSSSPSSDALDRLVQAVKNLNNPVSTNLNHFINPNSSVFFEYNGSRTFPPCTENVIWLVPNSPNDMGGATRDVLRSLLFYPGNFRNLQGSNGRNLIVHTSQEIVKPEVCYVQSEEIV